MIDRVVAEIAWRDAQLSDYFSAGPESRTVMSREELRPEPGI